MRLNLRLVDPRSGRVDHVVLDAEPDTPAKQAVEALNGIQPGDLFVKGAPLADDVPLYSTGLRDGDVVAVGKPVEAEPGRAGPELVAVGGPLSGDSWALSRGTVVVGRSVTSGLRLDDSAMSREHFRLTVDEHGCVVEDLGSTNGTFVDGGRAEGPTPLRPGSVVEAGASLFEVRIPARGDADIHSDEAGGLAFNRPARIRPAAREVKVVMPAEPSRPEPHPFPWVQVLAPLALGAVAALLLKSPVGLLFALFSPVFAVSTNISNRKRDERRSAAEAERYASDLASAQARLDEAAAREIVESREQFPDPAAMAAIAVGPERRLWERRPDDPDALLLRVGVGDRPATISISSRGGGGGDGPQPPSLASVPVVVDLAAAGVLGVAGPQSTTRAIVRWMVAQLAVLRSPRDLALVALCDADSAPDWEWLRWLPHARIDDPSAPVAMLGNDRVTREERVRELVKLLDVRLAARSDQRSGATGFVPSVVLVLDGIRALRFIPGVPRLLKEGPGVGIHAIGLDLEVARLAEEGRAQVVVDVEDPTLATVEVDGVEPQPAILLDQVAPAWADEVGRALAPIRDSGGEEGEASVPRSVRYVDLAGIDLDRSDEVVRRWSSGRPTTEALVGASAEGSFAIDLRRDGPHALVAGTTGSGKSEFLRTLVLSLALGNRPTAMSFVLVDYKGGSAFAECARLPHVVGLVTNLDGHLTERALVSLDAELKRREQRLKARGASDIEAAWEGDFAGAAGDGLGRLVIVIDEFAELVHELPDFVTGLIRIARVGRSLGVHLILATQRPSGVVSPEMRANTGLRVALRMEDKEGSTEVLEAPHAAAISRTHPGRGFVRASAGRPVEFQTARVAGRRKGAIVGLAPPRANRVPWSRLGYPSGGAARSEEALGTATDLDALVDLIDEAARRLEIPRPQSPWLAALPRLLLLPPEAPERSQADDAPRLDIRPVPFGLEDVPSSQLQRMAEFDLEQGGHLLVAGAPRSGRSSALRTLAAALARSISPSDVHLYALDFGNGALLPLADLPHCGAVVSRSEADRIERLVDWLQEEMARRQEVLARGGFGDIGEQRRRVAAPDRLPYLVVLLDRFEGFSAQFPPDSGSSIPGALSRLVREGGGVGLRLVIAGDRGLLGDRLSSLVEDKLVLRLADRDDYRSAGIAPKAVPDEVPPGRAFRSESGIEVQLALLEEDPSGLAQAAAVRHIARQAEERWPPGERTNRPRRVDLLPSAIGFAAATALRQSTSGRSPLWALVGVGGDELAGFGVDLSVDAGFVVAGPSRSGRSGALVVMARSLAAQGVKVVALCPRLSPLEGLTGGGTDFPAEAVQVFSGEAGPLDPAEVSATLVRLRGPVAVLVDDAGALARGPVDEAVRDFVKSASRGRVGLIVAGMAEELRNELKGVAAEAKKARCALLLSPSSTLDGDLVGVRLPRNLVGRMPAGRGVLVVGAKMNVVQVPN